MKRVRLAIAKWALKPDNITLKEVTKVTGVDFEKIINDAQKQAEQEIAKMKCEVERLMNEANNKLAANQIDTTKITQEQVKQLIGENFANLTAETLQAVIVANDKLSETQKAQISAILAGPKTDLTYLQ